MAPTSAILAARRYGPLVDRVAASYRNPVTGRPLSGAALLLKLAKGESGFRPGEVSSAGARGETQFTPGSRRVAIQRFGVDPWRSTDEAFHAAALHLLGKINGSPGLKGYNPGDPSYTGYILGQKVGGTGATTGGAQAPSAVPGSTGQADGVPQGSTGILPLLQQLAQQPQQAPSGGLQAPAVSAHAAMPQGAQVPLGGGGPAPKPDVSALLAAIQTAGGDVPGAASSQGAVSGSLSGSGAAAQGNGRTARFDGKPVRSDFADQLAWARAQGWKGTVISGYRTKAEQVAAAKRYGLQHYGPAGPLGSNHVYGHPGAVDVSNPQQLDQILRRYPGKRTLIWGGPVIGDRPHFSPTGH